MTLPIPLKFSLKLAPSPADNRDRLIHAVAPLSVKGSVDLSEYCTTVKNQGPLGSCTAFAAVAAMEFIQKRFNGNTHGDIYSERFTYWATRVNVRKQPPTDSGAYMRDAVKSLVKYGVCLENTFPYSTDCRTAPPESAYTEAENYQAVSYARFEDGNTPAERIILINALKATLDAGLPIMCGFICYANIWAAYRGLIPKKLGHMIGGHAVLIVGYDDNKSVFKFKNSWGTSWGDKGYGYLPYDFYIYGDMFDLWSIRTTENTNAQIIGLSIDKGPDPVITKEIVLAGTSDVLSAVLADLPRCLSKIDEPSVLDELAVRYASNPTILALIKGLKANIKTAASAIV